MKKFIKKIIIMLCIPAFITVSVNAVYGRIDRNCGTMSNIKNDQAYIKDVPDHIQICIFGNSHSFYGFNYDPYIAKYTCFNFSLPSQTMSYNLRILQNYQSKIAPGAVVLINISPQEFFRKKETDSPFFESNNQRYYHFLESRYIKEYNPKTALLVKYLPAISDPPVDVLKSLFGFNTIPNVWNDVMDRNNPAGYETDMYNPLVDSQGNLRLNREELDAAYQMAELCRSLGAEPVFITAPCLSEFTDHITEQYPSFFDEFFEIIDQLCADTGCEYYNYCFDKRFTSNYDYYINPHHLNINGAAAFTKVIMEEIISYKD